MILYLIFCYWHGRIFRRFLHFLLIAPSKSDPHEGPSSVAGSIMHSTRTFVITVSNDRVSCHPHLEEKILHLAAAVIVTRAHCCLTAAGHCDVMLGTFKFVDKSVNDNSARRLDHYDVIASRSGFGVATDVASGGGRMIALKPSLRSGFDCIIRPAPSGAGRTTPGHYPLSIP